MNWEISTTSNLGQEIVELWINILKEKGKYVISTYVMYLFSYSPQILGELCQQYGLHGQHYISLQGYHPHTDDHRELQAERRVEQSAKGYWTEHLRRYRR